MRPQSIVLFERITFAAFFAGLLNGALNWGALLDRTANISAHPAILLVLSLALGFLVTASLTLWVSRRRSKVAMWIGIALFAFGLPLTVMPFLNGTAIGSPVVPALAALAQIYAYCLLFTPSAARWMGHEPEISPEIFR